jgi:hypothetical protein
LKYINSTEHPVDLENPENSGNVIALNELKTLLSGINYKLDRVTVTLPSENAFISRIPSKADINLADIQKLVELEIRQAYPNNEYYDFLSSIIQFHPKLDGNELMLSVIIPKSIFNYTSHILGELNTAVSEIEIDHLNTHSAFLYNYPERKNETVSLIDVGKQFVDISVINAGRPVYYNSAIFENNELLGEICIDEFEKITSGYVDKIDSAYILGEGLNLDLLEIAQKSFAGRITKVGKLNSFRMFNTPLDKRQREYCARMAHIFPPCIGGNLPLYYKKIKVFQ